MWQSRPTDCNVEQRQTRCNCCPTAKSEISAGRRNQKKSRWPKGWLYVVQKHAASRLHYDFRLELDGVLKSWVVPKGPSLDPAVKRLAVQVEDHLVEYGQFEGIIPAGEYGEERSYCGIPALWEPRGDARQNLREGKPEFTLHGEKLRGGWVLVRSKSLRRGNSQPEWLLIKERDDEARATSDEDILKERPLSIATGRDLDGIAAAEDRVWSSRNGSRQRGAVKSADSPTAVASRLPLAKQGKLPAVLEPQLATLVEHAPRGEEWLLVTVNWQDETIIDGVNTCWDTHQQNFPKLKNLLCPLFDRAFSTFIADLHERGLLETTMVVALGEFGRTPKIGQFTQSSNTQSTGRDHWPHAFTAVAAGGGIRGGQVYGATTPNAGFVVDQPVTPADLSATILHYLGDRSAPGIRRRIPASPAGSQRRDRDQGLSVKPCVRVPRKPLFLFGFLLWRFRGSEPRLQILVDFIHGKRLRIVIAQPFQLLILVVVPFGFRSVEHLAQLLVTPDAAAIFGRAGSFPFDAPRIEDARLGIFRLADENVVLPAVAEIIFVEQSPPVIRDEIAQDRAVLIVPVAVGTFRIDGTQIIVSDPEGMEMAAGPSHCRLHDFVQISQRHIRDFDFAVNGRSCAAA